MFGPVLSGPGQQVPVPSGPPVTCLVGPVQGPDETFVWNRRLAGVARALGCEKTDCERAARATATAAQQYRLLMSLT